MKLNSIDFFGVTITYRVEARKAGPTVFLSLRSSDGVYIDGKKKIDKSSQPDAATMRFSQLTETQLSKEIIKLEKQMLDLAKNLEFEQAAKTRDLIHDLKSKLFGIQYFFVLNNINTKIIFFINC